MELKDQTLTCADCNNDFTFSAGEQQFYDQKGFSSPPKRCKSCRELRRRDRGGAGGGAPGRGRAVEVSEYRSPSFRDSDPNRRHSNYDGGSGRPARPRRAAAMPAAIDEYRAPSFSARPAPALPGDDDQIDEELDAIGNRAEGAAQRPPTPRVASAERQGRAGRSRAMHDIVCAECGKESRVPFKPQSGKPVYCRDCYQAKKDDPGNEAVG